MVSSIKKLAYSDFRFHISDRRFNKETNVLSFLFDIALSVSFLSANANFHPISNY